MELLGILAGLVILVAGLFIVYCMVKTGKPLNERDN